MVRRLSTIDNVEVGQDLSADALETSTTTLAKVEHVRYSNILPSSHSDDENLLLTLLALLDDGTTKMSQRSILPTPYDTSLSSRNTKS